jgi:hypothetical protein
MVTKDRVADELGGTCGAPSPLLASSAPKGDTKANDTTAADNTTANTTGGRLLAENETANTTTAPVKTEWTVNLFVLPDPYATAYVVDTV